MNNLLNKRYNLLPFAGEWFDAFGEPEASGVYSTISTQCSILPIHLPCNLYWLSPQRLFPVVEDFVIASYALTVGEMKCSGKLEFLLRHNLSYYSVFTVKGQREFLSSLIFLKFFLQESP